MARFGNDEWNSGEEVYAPEEVEAVLRALNITVQDETDRDFLSLCPYHGNTDTPAFSTSKMKGYSICFNPACGVGSSRRLTLEQMVSDLKGLDRIAAKRFIKKHRGDTGLTFEEKFDALDVEPQQQEFFPAGAIDKMHKRFMETAAAKNYMASRGFELKTMEHFNVGFTPASNGAIYRPVDMVVVPAYDHKGNPVGLVGRSIEGKTFKNYGPLAGGRGFYKSKMVWNLQNARKHETVIVCESTFDAMRIHQAGYPNVVALLGGSLSQIQKSLLSRHFNGIIIFTDNENKANGELTYHKHCSKCVRSGYEYCQGHAAGRELGMQIASELSRLNIHWATFDDKDVYARNVKDASDMTDDEIRQCLRNSTNHYEYLDWMVA